ncbi:MAG: MFS transporter [Lachnospiraceae bacterium]|nr:MFS transporter [Lachnospiraceae bacterium]
MRLNKYLPDKNMSRLLFLACWLTYMSAYIGRNTFKASIAALTELGVMTEPQAGFICSCYFICYAAGHLLNGILADRFDPILMIRTGLLGSSVANLLLGLTPNYTVMLVIWSANGFLQSMMWSPIIFLLSGVVVEEKRKKYVLNMLSSSPTGTIIAYFLAGFTAAISWKITFFSASAILFAVFLVFSFVSSRARRAMIPLPEPAPSEKKTEKEAAPAFLPLFVSSGALILLIPTVCHGMLKEGIMTWVPSLIKDTYGLSAGWSTVLTVIMPVCELFGAYFSSFLYKKFFRENEIVTGLFFMAVTALPTLVILNLAKTPLLVSIACLGLIAVFIIGYNYMFSTVVPVIFGKYRRAATFSGIFNCTIYIGAAISTYGFGKIVEKTGWFVTVAAWIGIAVVGSVVLALLIPKWKRFKNK